MGRGEKSGRGGRGPQCASGRRAGSARFWPRFGQRVPRSQERSPRIIHPPTPPQPSPGGGSGPDPAPRTSAPTFWGKGAWESPWKLPVASAARTGPWGLGPDPQLPAPSPRALGLHMDPRWPCSAEPPAPHPSSAGRRPAPLCLRQPLARPPTGMGATVDRHGGHCPGPGMVSAVPQALTRTLTLGCPHPDVSPPVDSLPSQAPPLWVLPTLGPAPQSIGGCPSFQHLAALPPPSAQPHPYHATPPRRKPQHHPCPTDANFLS